MAMAKMLLSVLMSTLGAMIQALMTEAFMKWLVIKLLTAVVKRTKTTADDEVLAKAIKEWK